MSSMQTKGKEMKRDDRERNREREGESERERKTMRRKREEYTLGSNLKNLQKYNLKFSLKL